MCLSLLTCKIETCTIHLGLKNFVNYIQERKTVLHFARSHPLLSSLPSVVDGEEGDCSTTEHVKKVQFLP